MIKANLGSKLSHFISLWWHFFARVFSVAAILLFVLSNVFQSELWNINQASALADGVGANLTPDSNKTNWTIVVSYDGTNGSFKAGDNITADFKVFHCKSASGGVCIPNGSSDYIGEVGSASVPFTIPDPSSGDVTIGTFSSNAVNCGRVQADLGVPGKDVFGGSTHAVGPDCPDAGNPNPPVDPNPCPNGGPIVPSNLKINGQPSGSSFPATQTSYSLTWDGPDGAEYFVRFDDPRTPVSPDIMPNNDPNAKISSKEFTVTGINDAGNYDWWVHSTNGCGTSAAVNATLVKLGATQPPVDPNPTCPAIGTPTNLSPNGSAFNAGTRNLTLSWSAAQNASSYEVQLIKSGGGLIANPTVNTTSVVITSGLEDGASYNWSVTATSTQAGCPGGSPARATLTINPGQGTPNIPSCISLTVTPNPAQIGQNVTLTPNIANTENLGSVKLRYFTPANSNLSDQGWYDITASATPNQGSSWTIPSTEIGNHFFDMVIYDKQGNPIDWWRNAACRTLVSINTTSNPEQPSCTIQASPTTGIAPLTVSYGATVNVPSGRSVASYQWDFNGDSVIDSTGNSGSHVFTNPGNYTSRLTITDSAGVTAACTLLITVTATSNPALTVSKFVVYNGQEYENVSANINRFGQNETVSYRIKITNTSSTVANNVVITDSLPAYMSPASIGNGTTSGNTITWNVGQIGSNGGVLNYTAKVAAAIPAGNTSQINTVTLTNNGSFVNSDQATVVIGRDAVNGEPVLSIEKTPSSQTVSAGGQATFTLKIRNTSGRALANIQVIDDLPSGFSYVAGSTTGSTTTNPTTSGQTLTWTGINLTDQQEWSVTFKATASTVAGTHTNNAKAIVESKTFGPVQANVIINPTGATLTPNITNNNTNNNTIHVNNTLPTVPGTATVAGVSILPKTGLPVLAWAAAAFIPLGAGLRKFGKSLIKDAIASPNFMWEDREFKK